jgi:GNAT superfamily N-acetyltransferase
VQFQRELFSNILDEALPLFKDHCQEVVDYLPDIDFDPDVESYILLDDSGHLRVFTIRQDNDGKLIGYCIHHVFKHLHHCKSLVAVQDSIFIHKDHRGIGRAFISWVDDQLKSEGVLAVYHYVSNNCDYSKALIEMDYVKIESTYLRRFH